MKATVLQENFLPKVAAVARVASSKSALPILENIFLSAEKGKLTLSATDLETGVSTTVGAKVENPGAVTVPARLLVGLIGNLPAGKITLSVEKEILKIETKKVSSKVNGLSAEEFPSFTTEGKKLLTLKAAELKKAINQVSFAVAQDESRPILTGVLLRLSSTSAHLAKRDTRHAVLPQPNVSKSDKPTGFTLVGVDGFRLAEKQLKVSSQEEVSLVIPVRGMMEVSRLLTGGEVEILVPEAGQLLFRTEEYAVFTQSLEGEFPAYEQIIPANFETKFTFEKEDLVRAVQLTAIFSDKGASIVKLSFDLAKKMLEVSSQEPELGEAKIKIGITGEGKAGNISFNGRYLMDALGALDSEKAELSLNTSLDPALFRVPSDSSYLHVVMPVRLQE